MLNVIWVPSTHIEELVAPYCYETFDFIFNLDPETLDICSLHPPAINLIFKTNPTSDTQAKLCHALGIKVSYTVTGVPAGEVVASAKTKRELQKTA